MSSNINDVNEPEYIIERVLINMVDKIYTLNPQCTTCELMEYLREKLRNIKIPENYPEEPFFIIDLDKYIKSKYVFIDGDKIIEINKEDIIIKNTNEKKDFFLSETDYYEVRFCLTFDFVEEEHSVYLEILAAFHKILLCSNPEILLCEQYKSYSKVGLNI